MLLGWRCLVLGCVVAAFMWPSPPWNVKPEGAFSLTLSYFLQGAVPKGNATKEFIESLQLKPGQVVYKCPKCCSIKPDRAHHCRYTHNHLGLASLPPITPSVHTRAHVHTHTQTHAHMHTLEYQPLTQVSSATGLPNVPGLGTEWPLWLSLPISVSSLVWKRHSFWAQDTCLRTWPCHSWFRALHRPLTVCTFVSLSVKSKGFLLFLPHGFITLRAHQTSFRKLFCVCLMLDTFKRWGLLISVSREM